MRFSKGLCFLSATLALLPTLASAQSFILSQNGKKVGDATLTITVKPAVAAPPSKAAAGKPAAGKTSATRPAATSAGFDLTSGVTISMQGLDYRFTETATLNAGYHVKTVQLDGMVNGTAASISLARAGQQFTMKINANGSVTSNPLAFHPQSVFMPDFDPGALQVLLKLAAPVNNLDLWAVIPKQTGSVAPLQIATMADEQGTLDNAPITVHHISVTNDTEKTEIFSGPDDELLQAEWTSQGFAAVREGFKLKPPKRPTGAPPARPAAAPPAGQPGPATQPAQPQQQ
jgi:hypothetical protein